jgi:hypothetical protein
VLDNHPVLKRALVNQYQLILAGAAVAASAALVSPLPLLLLLGGQLLSLPFLIERAQRRLEIEKKFAARQSESLTQEQRYEQLSPESRGRFGRFKRACDQIQENYKSLSAESQGVLAEQVEKFGAIQATALRRLWLAQKYEQMIRAFDSQRLRADIEGLRGQLSATDIKPRIREAWEQNLSIKEKLLETAERNVLNRTALLAELDSLESLLQLLMQKSLAATDAEAFSSDLDTILSQAEADAISVQEMEQLMGSMPELNHPTLSEKLTQDAANAPLPFTPKGMRGSRREKM